MLIEWISCRDNQEISVYEDEPTGTILFATDGHHSVVINLDDDKLEQLIRALQTQLDQRRERAHVSS